MGLSFDVRAIGLGNLLAAPSTLTVCAMPALTFRTQPRLGKRELFLSFDARSDYALL